MKTIRNEKARKTRAINKFIKKLINQQPSYEVNEQDAIDDIMNIGEQPTITYKTSNETNENTQLKIIVDDVMKQLKANPSNWELDIESSTKKLNNTMKAYFYRQFHQFFIKTIGKLDTTNKYFIKYFINGS